MKTLFTLLALSALPILGWAQPPDAFDLGYELAEHKGCLECHTLGRTDVGPSFRAVARRYRFDLVGQERLPYVIRGGSAGHWGERYAMWPQADLTDEEVRQLVDWVLSQ